MDSPCATPVDAQSVPTASFVSNEQARLPRCSACIQAVLECTCCLKTSFKDLLTTIRRHSVAHTEATRKCGDLKI
jgi:hypothetical protein